MCNINAAAANGPSMSPKSPKTSCTSPKALPEDADIAALADLQVLNITGAKVRLGSLFENQKVVLVFIRHFFCGNCQDYVSQLANVPQRALEDAGIKIIVIGCGDWRPIESYHDITEFRGPIYADPYKKAYGVLGMIEQSLSKQAPRSSYVSANPVWSVLRSIWRGPIKNPSLIGKSGNIFQLGGDFIFGPGNTCTFASRMQHTYDHVPVADLMAAAGVALP